MAVVSSFTTSRNVDIIFCIDATGSMIPCLDQVKANAKKFYQDFAEKLSIDYNSSVDSLNVKVIAFRDYGYDKDKSMEISRWFDLTAGDETDYEAFLSNIVAMGGGDNPENGLEALFLAMTSDWNAIGDKDRQVIVLFTDDDALPLKARDKSPDYPANMVDEDGLVNTWMGTRPDFMDQSDYRLRAVCKRLIMFAPADSVYKDLVGKMFSAQFIPVNMSEGLREIDFSDIIKAIAASVSVKTF